MRFIDLKIGEHFYFEGMEYTKSSPVLATDKGGSSRFIPRSAVLQTHSQPSQPTSRQQVSQLDQFYQTVTHIIRQEVHDSDLDVRLRQAIESAWQQAKNHPGKK